MLKGAGRCGIDNARRRHTESGGDDAAEGIDLVGVARQELRNGQVEKSVARHAQVGRGPVEGGKRRRGDRQEHAGILVRQRHLLK